MPYKIKMRKNAIIIAASYGVGLTIIFTLINYIGLNKVFENITSRMNYQLFIATFILDIAGLLIYALIWYLLLIGVGSKVKFITSITSTWASIFIMYLSPTGVVLELLKLVLANKEGKVPIGRGIAALTMQRIIYSISFISIAISSYIVVQYRYMVIGEAIGRIIAALIIIALITVITLIIMGRRTEKLESIIFRIYEKYQNKIEKMLSKYNPTEVINSISSTINEFKNSFKALCSKKTILITTFILTMMNWILNVMILYVVLLSLGYKISIWILMLIMVLCEFVQMTPIIIPGMLGIIETVMTATLQIFGIPLEISGTASILTRLATFWFDIPITAIAASYYGIKYLLKGVIKED